MIGTVKWFNEKKGFGFLVGADGTDLFVHYSEIRVDGFKTLREGQAVQYEPGQGERGPVAKSVTPMGP